MEFWTTLIKTTQPPKGAALKSLEDNCTHVSGDYWIMEGDVDCLRDDGVKLVEIAEGAVDALGDLTETELIEVCWDAYGYQIVSQKEQL